MFFYFADITHSYALAGFVLLLYADRDVAHIVRATASWWAFAALWTLLLIVPSIGAPGSVPVEWLEEARLNFEASARLGYWEQWPLRVEMFLWQVQANLLALPSVVALMMTGMLAHRSGWLSRPDGPRVEPSAATWTRRRTAGRTGVRDLVRDACVARGQPPAAGLGASAAVLRSSAVDLLRRSVPAPCARRLSWPGSHRPGGCR